MRSEVWLLFKNTHAVTGEFTVNGQTHMLSATDEKWCKLEAGAGAEVTTIRSLMYYFKIKYNKNKHKNRLQAVLF